MYALSEYIFIMRLYYYIHYEVFYSVFWFCVHVAVFIYLQPLLGMQRKLLATCLSNRDQGNKTHSNVAVLKNYVMTQNED